MDAVDKINVRLDRLRNREPADEGAARIPATIQQATAAICFEGADLLARDAILQGDVPAADLLQKYGQIQSKLAEARQDFNRALQRKFIEPFSTYSGAYDNANVLKAVKAASTIITNSFLPVPSHV